MTTSVVPGTLRTATPFRALVRTAILLVLIVCGVFGQPPQPRSEEDRVAEMKRRVIEILQLRTGDTAADVGCGEGFYTVPLARFLGPSGKVWAVDINDTTLLQLKQNLAKEGLKNVEVIKGAEDDPKLPENRILTPH